jgi:hypothetical protein
VTTVRYNGMIGDFLFVAVPNWCHWGYEAWLLLPSHCKIIYCQSSLLLYGRIAIAPLLSTPTLDILLPGRE